MKGVFARAPLKKWVTSEMRNLFFLVVAAVVVGFVVGFVMIVISLLSC